jgi:hypothetical protein
MLYHGVDQLSASRPVNPHLGVTFIYLIIYLLMDAVNQQLDEECAKHWLVTCMNNLIAVVKAGSVFNNSTSVCWLYLGLPAVCLKEGPGGDA